VLKLFFNTIESLNDFIHYHGDFPMKVVISGVNLIEGGPLKVFQDAVVAFSKIENVELICLVNNISLFDSCMRRNIQFIEFPIVKKSWLLRCLFEYGYCWFLSKKIKPDIWLAMHDMTPILCRSANIKQYVYCHNPSPAYDATLKDFVFDYKFFLFSKLYKFLYKLNISSNEAVICQQKWFADLFESEFKIKKTIVAKPNSKESISLEKEQFEVIEQEKNIFRFFYPALPRMFKNFELLLDAVEFIERNFDRSISKEFELIITIDGTESRYAKWLYAKYSHLNSVKFVGCLNREQVNTYYLSADLILFPSKLETWGLPIVEAKDFNKPILLANLPYAHETLGEYDKVKFINVNDHKALAVDLICFINGNLVYDKTSKKNDKE